MRPVILPDLLLDVLDRLLRVAVLPLLRIEIPVEVHEVSLVEHRLDALAADAVRRAEPHRRELGGLLDRLLAVVDLAGGARVVLEPAQILVGHRVVRDDVTLAQHPRDDRGRLLVRGHLADQEEHGVDVVLRECVEHRRCGLGIRAIIEREDQLGIARARRTGGRERPALGMVRLAVGDGRGMVLLGIGCTRDQRRRDRAPQEKPPRFPI